MWRKEKVSMCVCDREINKAKCIIKTSHVQLIWTSYLPTKIQKTKKLIRICLNSNLFLVLLIQYTCSRWQGSGSVKEKKMEIERNKTKFCKIIHTCTQTHTHTITEISYANTWHTNAILHRLPMRCIRKHFFNFNLLSINTIPGTMSNTLTNRR